MEKTYSINLLLICLTAICSDVVYCAKSRLKRRISNVEIKLDTVNSDIASFRLDMLDVWKKMEDMNKAMCPKEKANSSKKMEETNTKTKPLVESHVSEKKLYSAFQSEKRLVREYSQTFKENINMLEKGQKSIEMLVNKQAENIEKIEQDIEILNSKNVFKNVLTEAISEVSKNIQTIDDKVFVLEHAQENMAENMKKHAENIKTAIQDKETFIQKLKKMDQLQSEVKTLKVTMDNVMNQMNMMQLALDVLKDRAACSPPWYSYGQSCYHFSEHALTGQSAKHYCKSMGSYLAEYKDIEEAKAVAELALSISSNNLYWIEASDSVWSTSPAYSDYDYYGPTFDRSGYCVTYMVNLQGQYGHSNYDNKLNFICETAKLKL